jgi:hypothetical protein
LARPSTAVSPSCNNLKNPTKTLRTAIVLKPTREVEAVNKPQPLEETEYTLRRGSSVACPRIFVLAMVGALCGAAIWLVNAFASTIVSPDHNLKPIVTGYGVGSISVREKDYTTELKCDGCKVECFDRFVVITIDRTKEPTWTDNFTKVIPWDKIDSITLRAQQPAK